jgi:hypothetical protein
MFLDNETLESLITYGIDNPHKTHRGFILALIDEKLKRNESEY